MAFNSQRKPLLLDMGSLRDNFLYQNSAKHQDDVEVNWEFFKMRWKQTENFVHSSKSKYFLFWTGALPTWKDKESYKCSLLGSVS